MPLTGHLELICAADDAGRSVLRHQSFSAPIHLSKPHWDGETLMVNVVNPTPGLFGGDVIRCDIRVETGAKLLLTAPSASRAHATLDAEARVDQTFFVANGGRLEVFPELFIPQGGARYRQTTRASVEAGGELFLFEVMAPGRVASGEVFAYDWLVWDTDIVHAGRLIARERYTIRPQNPPIIALRDRFHAAYYASCFVISPHLTQGAPCWDALEYLQSETVWIGWSGLCGASEKNSGSWVIKVLAGGSIEMRKALAAIREALYGALGSKAPGFRRV